MRIGIDCRFWNETGVGRYIRNLVEQLQVIDKTNEYVLFVRSRDYARIKNQELRIKDYRWKVVKADIRWHSVEEQFRFPQILNRENLDLMHFPYFSVPLLYTKPFVITIHDLIINHFPTGQATTLPLPFYKLKYLGYQFVLQQAARRAKKILTVSNATKKEIIEHLNVPEKKIVVSYEGVDKRVLSNKNQKSSLKETYFLYVGNAYPHKNLEFLLNGFKIFTDQQKNVRLVLVGKDDFFYKRLKEKVVAMGLSNSVIFLQNVEDDELGNLYHHATAVVLPSLMEGFGLPAVEAMGAGSLVVASDIPAFREVCKDVALYFGSAKVNELVLQLQKISTMPKGYFDKNIEAGYSLAKKYSWEKMAKETKSLYESCISL